MDFSLTDEQRLVQQQARELLERHAAPEAAREWQRRGGACPPELWARLAEAGWPGYAIPVDAGGLGADLVDLALLFEECGRAVVPGLLRSTTAVGLLLAAGGSPAQQAEHLRALARGALTATLAVAEPDVLHDLTRLGTVLSAAGDGYRLRGEKRFVVAGVEADLLTVAAAAPRGGLALALVPRTAPGVDVEPLPSWTGEALANVRFTDTPVSTEALVGEPRDAEALLAGALVRETALLAAELLGGLARTVELTVGYVKERVQFGRPIGSFQAVQHMCADLATWLEASRALVYQAVWRLAQGLPAAREVAIAKAWTARRFKDATLTAHQLHGGMGFVTEYPLHLFSNRAKAGEALCGTHAVQMEHIAAAMGL